MSNRQTGFSLASIAAVLIAAALGWWLVLSRTNSPKQSPNTATWASRLDVRQAIEQENYSALFSTHAANQLTSADLQIVSERLLARQRIVLAWLALEAARRLDPADRQARDALDSLKAQSGTNQSAHRPLFVDAAARAEALRRIRDGHAFTTLVIGILAVSESPDHERELLDRLQYLESNRLPRVQSAGDARKLIARLLLAAGQPEQALATLAPDPNPGDSAQTDPEREWLVSRAQLQLGRQAEADLALSRAGAWGDSGPDEAEPAPYVGARRCASCHRIIYRAQQGSSRHALTLARGHELANTPLPDRPVHDPFIPGLSHQLNRSPDGAITAISRLHDKVQKAVVEYAVGSGRHGITMVAQDEHGVDRQLRISFLHSVNGFRVTKGASASVRNDGELLGLALSAETVTRCLHCHATWFRGVDRRLPGPFGPEAKDHGIGCERCHGPGLHHLKAVETGFAQSAIALTARSTNQARLDSCVPCHAADSNLKPSDPEFTRAQGTTMLYSLCYSASGQRLTCTTCHDPHHALDETTAHYEQKCLSCHSPNPPPNTSQTNAQPPHPNPSHTCPVNPRQGCINCHMPKVDDLSRLTRYTDHHIRVHREP